MCGRAAPAVDTWAFSARGAQAENEDSLFFHNTAVGGAWIVADGLGGHGHGALASQMATDVLAEHARREPSRSDAAVLRWIADANGALLAGQRADTALTAMRTTVAAVFRHGRRMRLYHAGDTRIYYFRKGEFLYQSKDHSLPQLAVETGDILPTQIRDHPDRGVLTRALGMETASIPQGIPFTTRLTPRDAFLLCTDGFWEYVLEEEMRMDLAQAGNAEDWAARMLERRARRAAGNREQDNYTVVACVAGKSKAAR